MFSRLLGERPVNVDAPEPKCCILARRVLEPPTPRPGFGIRRTCRKPGGSSFFS